MMLGRTFCLRRRVINLVLKATRKKLWQLEKNAEMVIRNPCVARDKMLWVSKKSVGGGGHR
jgi:hypothetical protein